MQKLSSENVKTFSVGFEEADFDESVAAQAVAEFLERIKELPRHCIRSNDGRKNDAKIYDEPFGDSLQSQLI